MSNKHYPEEFKLEAVKQVTDHGHAVTSDTSYGMDSGVWCFLMTFTQAIKSRSI